MIHNDEYFINEINELIRDNELSKLNAASLIGKVELLNEEGIITFDQCERLIAAIKDKAKLTKEEVDEALFYA